MRNGVPLLPGTSARFEYRTHTIHDCAKHIIHIPGTTNAAYLVENFHAGDLGSDQQTLDATDTIINRYRRSLRRRNARRDRY